MQADRQIRALLVLLLAGVGVLVVRELTRGDAGRFAVVPLRAGSPVLVRTDTATGMSWTLELRAGGGRWVPVDVSSADPLGRALPPSVADEQPEAQQSEQPRALAPDEIKALANAILGDELAPDIRIWAVGQLAVTEDRRATLALIQLLEVADDPPLVALIREALEQRDDPRAREALQHFARTRKERSP